MLKKGSQKALKRFLKGAFKDAAETKSLAESLS